MLNGMPDQSLSVKRPPTALGYIFDRGLIVERDDRIVAIELAAFVAYK